MYGQLAPDHLVLGLGVALDIDQIHIRLDTFVDAVGQVDLPVTGGVDLRLGNHVDVTPGSVEIPQFLQIGTHTLRGIKGSSLHLEIALNVTGRHDRRALNR